MSETNLNAAPTVQNDEVVQNQEAYRMIMEYIDTPRTGQGYTELGAFVDTRGTQTHTIGSVRMFMIPSESVSPDWDFRSPTRQHTGQPWMMVSALRPVYFDYMPQGRSKAAFVVLEGTHIPDAKGSVKKRTYALSPEGATHVYETWGNYGKLIEDAQVPEGMWQRVASQVPVK